MGRGGLNSQKKGKSNLNTGAIMSEFLRIITHARRLKSNLKDISIEQLEDIRNKLTSIIDARLIEEEEEKKKAAEKQEKIRKYKEMMEADGIGLDELQAISGDRPGKRSPRKPKYEIYNESGQRITWTGQGRMPNLLKDRVENGESLDTFLIDS